MFEKPSTFLVFAKLKDGDNPNDLGYRCKMPPMRIKRILSYLESEKLIIHNHLYRKKFINLSKKGELVKPFVEEIRKIMEGEIKEGETDGQQSK